MAAYRQTVLVAFREVEDSLADVRWLSQQAGALDSSLAGAKRAQRISRSRYDAGAVDYLTVIDADRTVLQSQREANAVAGLRAAATVSLVRRLVVHEVRGDHFSIFEAPRVTAMARLLQRHLHPKVGS